MNIDQISGILALTAQAAAAVLWLVAALKRRIKTDIWLATGFFLLWIPIVLRIFPGEIYALDGERVMSMAYVGSRFAYVMSYVCFAVSAIIALRDSRNSQHLHANGLTRK